MSLQQTLQQRRAASASADVDSMKGDNEYGSLVRSLPALIQSDGLATTLVFLQAKGKKHHQSAYKHVSHWVMSELSVKNETDLLKWLIADDTDSFQYRVATTEALAYLAWLKRFAEAKGIES